MDAPPLGSSMYLPGRHQQQVLHSGVCSPSLLRHPSSSGGAYSQDSPVATEAEYNTMPLAQMHSMAQQHYDYQPQSYEPSFQQPHAPRQQQVEQQANSQSMANFFDPLAHSSLFTAALADPSGSLSHIDFGLLSTPTDNPPSCQPMPLPQFSLPPTSLDLSLGDMKGDEEGCVVSPFRGQSSLARQAGKASMTVHPEVGDIICDGSLSHEHIISHFREYANRVGFVMTRNFDNVDSSGRYRRVRVACKQGGLPRRTTKHENPAMQRERTSQKVGCPFEVTIWRTKQRPGGVQAREEQWVVTNVKGINHGPCPLLGNTCHTLSSAHDGIHKDAQDQIKAQIKKAQLSAQHGKLSEQGLADQRIVEPAPAASLARFLCERVPIERRCDTMLLLLELTSACKRIADGLTSASAWTEQPPHFANMAVKTIKSALACLSCVHASAIHPGPEVLNVADTGRFSVAVDALVGAEDAGLGPPYGTVFGIYSAIADSEGSPGSDFHGVVQAGVEQVAAGYVLYSHPPTLVLALAGAGSHAFMLDRSSGDFVLARTDLQVPTRGQRCTVLEADRQLWPAELKQYVDMLERGEGDSNAPYAVTTSRSLLADFHATLLEGGILIDPIPRKGLVRRFNPLALVMEQAGGGATDGARRMLALRPIGLDHQAAVSFGSQADVAELASLLSRVAGPPGSC